MPAEERTISLQTIADRTKLNVDGAEFLLMKTLSLHLIEGVIDEVDSTVQVRATRPMAGRLLGRSSAHPNTQAWDDRSWAAWPPNLVIDASRVFVGILMTAKPSLRVRAMLRRSAGCSPGC